MEQATYWDSSALIAAAIDPAIREKLSSSGQPISRTHALAEVFSTVTGGRLGYRIDADDAAKLLKELSSHLEFVDLDATETLKTLAQARAKGTRGGQVHDYLHAAAAMKAQCSILLTLNLRDLANLFEELTVVEP